MAPTASATWTSPQVSPSTLSATLIRTWWRRFVSRPARCGMSRASIAFQKPSVSPSGCARQASPTLFSSAIPALRPWKLPSRRRASISGKPERHRVITFEGAFHGRTLATLAAGGQKKYLEGFGPVVAGFDQVPLGDLDAVKAMIGPETAAILIEPIQGEGGGRVVPTPFLKALRELCDKHGLVLVFDEVQTGMGRSGSLFAHQRCGVTPDVMGIAKALGGGFPVGACLTTAEAGKGMTAGTHGSTFGANPLAMTVGNAVLDLVLAPEFQEKVRRSAILFRQGLAEIRDRHPGVIAEVRGEGLLLGLLAVCPNGELVEALRAERLLAAAAGDNVVRMLPPLIIDEPEIAEAINRIDGAAARIEFNQRERVAAGAKP